MNIENMIEKVDFSKYAGRYDESINEKLSTSPRNVSLEQIRSYLYGYTFTEDYVKGIFPDQMSMDYWRDNASINDEDVEFSEICIDGLHTGLAETFDGYFVDSVQESIILMAIDSTGDGKTPETALCVTDVGQEYEYISRVFPYCMLKFVGQKYQNGVDCLEFEDNKWGVERIYFDIHRRFEVGYPM